MDIEKIIRTYLPNIIHMSLGTTSNNIPWVCEVHFSYDEDLNLYFMSTPARRHSVEIAENPHVAGTITVQHGLGEKPRGIYFEGMARVVSDGFELSRGFECYQQRFSTKTEVLEEMATPEGRKLYKISVDTFYVFDAQDSIPAQKYTLEWNSGRN